MTKSDFDSYQELFSLTLNEIALMRDLVKHHHKEFEWEVQYEDKIDDFFHIRLRKITETLKILKDLNSKLVL